MPSPYINRRVNNGNYSGALFWQIFDWLPRAERDAINAATNGADLTIKWGAALTRHHARWLAEQAAQTQQGEERNKPWPTMSPKMS